MTPGPMNDHSITHDSVACCPCEICIMSGHKVSRLSRRPTNNQLSLFHLSSSDPIAQVGPHQWQDQTAALITTVRMKEAGLMSSDRGMYTSHLDKKEASIIAPRLPIS
ncbi:hypothetical protein PO909_015594 [Leuciscus waleckii]